MSLGACGLLIGLEDHQPFPGGDAGPDAEGLADAAPDAVDTDAPADVAIDGCAGAICSEVCVDTETDPHNCGGCGVVCAKGFKCEAAVCGNHIDQISAGANHGCELLHEGTVWCWGSDVSGQLGIAEETDLKCGPGAGMSCYPTPIKVVGLPPKMVSVAAGANFTCAVDVAGAVWCWGANEVFQLGRATTSGAPNSAIDRIPLPIPNLAPVSKVSAGYGFACARLADGSNAVCWGSNARGTLGNGKVPSPAGGFPPGPVALMPPDGVVDVAAGLGEHACALTTLHKVWCWGSNPLGQLGHSMMTDGPVCSMMACNSTPTEIATVVVPGDTISTSVSGTCADDSAGFMCWGSNMYGQIGAKIDIVEHPVPTPVYEGLDAILGSTDGRYNTTCALTKTGGFNCWGEDTYGELGRGDRTKLTCAAGGLCDPAPVAGILPVTATSVKLSTGAHWGMVLTKNNQIYAWGANLDGRIGHAPNTGTPADYTDCGYGGMEICNPTPMLILQPNLMAP